MEGQGRIQVILFGGHVGSQLTILFFIHILCRGNISGSSMHFPQTLVTLKSFDKFIHHPQAHIILSLTSLSNFLPLGRQQA